MNKKSFLYFLGFVLLALSLSACQGAAQTTPTVNPNAKVTEAVLTVYAQMTQSATEAPPPTPTNTLVPSPTPTIVQPTQIPTEAPAEETGDQDGGEEGGGGDAGGEGGGAAPTATTAPTNPPPPTEEASMPCYRANLEYETIPDGTEFYPGQEFTKMWRLKNTGTCAWNENFYLRFVDGDILNAPANVRLTNERVPTWGFVNIEVDMTAPAELGTHKGYWMIVSDDGKIFGINPDGAGWFWVEIKVVDPDK